MRVLPQPMEIEFSLALIQTLAQEPMPEEPEQDLMVPHLLKIIVLIYFTASEVQGLIYGQLIRL